MFILVVLSAEPDSNSAWTGRKEKQLLDLFTEGLNFDKTLFIRNTQNYLYIIQTNKPSNAEIAIR